MPEEDSRAATRTIRGGFQEGKEKFDFNRGIYAHDDVKEALRLSHHGKCCYCESHIEHVGWSNVEHWRPKGAVRQAEDSDLLRPGYYWLAYEWSNLLLSCQKCNTGFKKDLFPLANPGERARSHKDAVEKEEPLLLNLGDEDPAEFIEFRGEIAHARQGNVRADTTIRVLGLNERAPLEEKRRRRLARLSALYKVARISDAILDSLDEEKQREVRSMRAEAQRRIEEVRQPEAEFFSMIQDALQTDFKYFKEEESKRELR